MRHSALQSLIRQMILLSILDENRSRFDEAERHICLNAFLTKRFHPVKIAGSRTVVILPAAENLLNLTGGQIFLRLTRPI